MISTATRWTVLGLVVGALFAAVFLKPSDRRRLKELPRPNILLIVTDDQHPAAIQHMPTVLGKIADRGVRFENAFASTPICAPSRASILTGQYPSTHGVFANGVKNADGTIGNGAVAFDDTTSLAVWMQEAGYKTALLGKYLNQYPVLTPRVPAGWDDWRVFAEDIEVFFDYNLNENGQHVHYGDADEDYSTDVLTRHAVNFIETNADQPWFLVFSPFAPHDPSQPAPRHLGSLDELPEWRPPSWNEHIERGKPGWIRLGAAQVKEAGLAARTRRRIPQLESLLAVDEAIGTILATLDERGMTENTVVIFTTDHGVSWGEHRWTGKQVAYEEAIRAPLIVRYPARWPAAATLSELALNVDIAPTIARLANATPMLEVEGRSLVDLLDGNEESWRQAVVLRHFRGGFLVPPWDSIRTSRYKLIRTGRYLELYDLAEDPNELDSRAKDPAYKAIRDDLSKQLDAILAQRKH